MDRRERSPDATTSMLAVLAGFKSELWTAMPGIVQSFNAAQKTCVVQPSLKARIQSQDDTRKWVSLPLLVDCPVHFPSGGGFTLTFPVTAGDECLVVFASRCIDAWWQQGGVQTQPELRMLDLSDGFCFVGISSLPSVTPAISTSGVELRSTDGLAKVRIAQATKDISVITPGDVSVQATNVTITGSAAVNLSAPSVSVNAQTLDVNATAINFAAPSIAMSGLLTINGADYTSHVHTGVEGGNQNTGGVA